MKIENIKIVNFKGIDAFKGDISGRNVYLIGGNGTGKTSFIDAVWSGLTGKNLPPEPVKTGAKKGSIEIDLGDYIARTKFTRGRPAVFEIENKLATKDTEKFIKAPRSFMEDKIGILNFDINEFFNKTDAEQLKYFAKLTGEDFSELDTEIEEALESRKYQKNDLKTLNDTLGYYDDKEANKELVDVVALSKKIMLESKRGETFLEIESGVEERKDKLIVLTATIEKLKEEQSSLNKEINGGEAWLKDPINIPMNLDEFTALEESLNSVTDINKKITAAKTARLQETEIKEIEERIEKSNTTINDLREKKTVKISKAIKVEGLTYSTEEERFLYNGLPFDKKQINTAAQLIAGLKIGASTLKDLKILKVDASLIDKNNFEEVLSWAASENIELFIELVDREATKLVIEVDVDN